MNEMCYLDSSFSLPSTFILQLYIVSQDGWRPFYCGLIAHTSTCAMAKFTRKAVKKLEMDDQIMSILGLQVQMFTIKVNLRLPKIHDTTPSQLRFCTNHFGDLFYSAFLEIPFNPRKPAMT